MIRLLLSSEEEVQDGEDARSSNLGKFIDDEDILADLEEEYDTNSCVVLYSPSFPDAHAGINTRRPENMVRIRCVLFCKRTAP